MSILTDDMQRVVREQRLGFVASVCPDGTSNLSPKGTTSVYDGDHLMFADICSPQTVANIVRHPVVEINVLDPLLRKGYRFMGTATLHRDGERFEHAIALNRERGVVRRITSIVLVRVDRALPLISPAYDDGATEMEIGTKWERDWRSLWDARAVSRAESAIARPER